MRSLFLFVVLMFTAVVSFAAESNVPEAVDPALGQKLQQIHQRGLQYKANKFKVTVSPVEMERARKAVEATQCAGFSSTESQGGVGKKRINYCPHCGLIKCAECSAAIAAAIAACGGPEDLPCIVAALGVGSTCLGCYVK